MKIPIYFRQQRAQTGYDESLKWVLYQIYQSSRYMGPLKYIAGGLFVILNILPMLRVYGSLEMQCRYNIRGYETKRLR